VTDASATASASASPTGVKTDTVWVWLIILTPLLELGSLFLIDFTGYIEASIAEPESIRTILSLYTSPGFVILLLGSFVIYGLTVVFAVLDVRELRARGVVNPFHWAFAFIGQLVYVIGRSVVVKTRTGQGLGPLWGMIGAIALSFVVALIWTVVLTVQIAELMVRIG